MALNIKNAEVEIPAAEVARLARIDAALDQFREQFPDGDFGRRLTKEGEENILGYGPRGV